MQDPGLSATLRHRLTDSSPFFRFFEVDFVLAPLPFPPLGTLGLISTPSGIFCTSVTTAVVRPPTSMNVIVAGRPLGWMISITARRADFTCVDFYFFSFDQSTHQSQKVHILGFDILHLFLSLVLALFTRIA